MTAHSEWQYFHCGGSTHYDGGNSGQRRDVTSMFAINTKTMQASEVFWRRRGETGANFQKLISGKFKKYKVEEYTTTSEDQLRWKKWGRRYYLNRESKKTIVLYGVPEEEILILEEEVRAKGSTWLNYSVQIHQCHFKSLNQLKSYAKSYDEMLSDIIKKRRL